MAKTPHLRVISGGKGIVGKGSAAEGKKHPQSKLDHLLSGRVTDTPARNKTRGRRKEQPPIDLPRNVQKFSDVFAAGRLVQKEVDLRAEFARQKLETFCLEQIAKEYAAVNRRPASRNFKAKHSRFKFVLTERTTLTSEKSEELKDMNIPIDDYTEVRGIKIDYDAIRRHGLEGKLRVALASMHIAADVLDEVLAPVIQLKESFYEVLGEVIKTSLKQGEELEEKLQRTLEVLNPATQIRNVEVLGLTARQCFDLVNQTEIEAEDEIA